MRAIVTGFISGLFVMFSTASGAYAAEETSSRPIEARPTVDTCVTQYRREQYADALKTCVYVTKRYLPELKVLKTTKNMQDVITISDEMFALTFTMAQIYRHFEAIEKAHKEAMHAVCWGLTYLAAARSRDADAPDGQSIRSRIDELEDVFPGVYSAGLEEFKAAHPRS